MKKTDRLFYVRCDADGSWLTTRRTEGGGHIFEHAPEHPALVHLNEKEWSAPYSLIVSPFTTDTRPANSIPETTPNRRADFADLLALHGFSYEDAKIDQKWSNIEPENAVNGFARVTVDEANESFDVYRFTPSGCLAWQITGIQFEAVPSGMLAAILMQLIASLEGPA